MKLLRRHWAWLIAATFAGIAGAGLISARVPVRYTSVAQDDVEPHAIANTTPIAPNLATEKLVATSGVVLLHVARVLGVDPTTLAAHLGASESGTSNILSIGCTMPAARQAQRCASVASAAYVAYRNRLASPKATRSADPLQAALVTAAPLPAAPSGTSPKILLPLGAILGLALGLGGALMRDALDGRVRDQADLEQCLNAAVVAAVPRVRRRQADPALVFSQAPSSRAAEAYRYLRARLEPRLRATAERGTVLLVTGAQTREGRTTVASNLAAALAQAGATVLLVDADLQRPSLTESFGTGARPGLTGLLTGQAALRDVAVPTAVRGLMLVPAGESVDRPADLLGAAGLARTFSEMREVADVVVVDSAPVLAASDAITLARVSDVVVAVADVRRTRRAAARAAAAQFAAAGATTVGVLNRVKRPLLADRPRPGMAPRPPAPARQSGNGHANQAAVAANEPVERRRRAPAKAPAER